ncbi:hypothetical protein TTHT_1239 [Thermotomaculum hydrothermale]|uniref:Uncharacterized protein n=1 Tax=Thermotomaculum hydrothermale TaxID=981385 RepID=A0A7R6PU82_9BACT|nr:choice-of-anchor J domain-containing protein [Thermotomaculum hydrothermale]BBB32757.1 hypothetical protein TTHT_1239 [Thermotomaculum hydrothermale]
MKKQFFLLLSLIIITFSAAANPVTKSFSDSYKYHLYFPLAFHDNTYTSYIGLLNLNDSIANYVIHISDSNGNLLIENVTGTLNAGERIYREICDEQLNSPCWVMVSSDKFLAGYMNTISNDLTESYFYLPDTGLSKSIYVPHIAPETNYWYTYTALVNGDFENVCSPYFDYFSDLVTLPAPVNPLEQSYFEWETDIFNGSFPDNMRGWGKIYTTGNATLSGMETFKVKADGIYNTAGLSLPSELTDTLYFPHIHVEGGYWWTGIAVNNASEITLPVTFHAISSDGTELDSVTWFIDPYSKLVKLAQSLWTDKDREFPENTAWIKVTCTEKKIIGYELFGTLESQGRRLLAGLNSPIEGYKELIFPHIESNSDYWTGIAFVNIGDENATVQVTAYNDEGKALQTITISDSFKPNEKYVSTVKAMFNNNVPEGTTYLKISSSQEIVGFELWGNLIPEQDYISGMLATPAIPVVFKEGFENSDVIDSGSWKVVQAKDNEYSGKGWQVASKLSLGIETWASQFPQTPPEGSDYVVGYYGTSSALNHQYLVSPQIDLPANAKSLTYFYQFGWTSTAVESCNVYITEDLNTNDGIDFNQTTLIKEYTPSYMESLDKSTEVSDFTVWMKENLDISQFAGKKVKIIFEIKSKYQQSFHLDKIEVR